MHMKTIKYRFSVFLKQFRIEDLKVLMQFLEMIVNEYKNSNASKLFGKSFLFNLLYIYPEP
jgi:hypothetical protein